MKLHHVGILLSVFGIVGITTPSNFNNVQAALTAPADYDYSYRQSNIHIVDGSSWAVRNNLGSTLSILPIYSTSTDGAFLNFTTTFELLNNFEITQTFNRSNTPWTSVGGTSFKPSSTASAIGSNNSVGSIASKLLFSFNNETKNHYRLYIDISSTPIFSNIWSISYPDLFTGSSPVIDTYFTGRFMVLYIPIFTRINFTSLNTSNPVYLDAWYLEDLGVSDGYTTAYLDGYEQGADNGYTNGYSDGYIDGYDLGETDGYEDGYAQGEDDGYASGLVDGYDQGATAMLTNGGMFGIMEDVLQGANAIFSIPVFGPTITLGTLALFPLLGVVIFFFKKVIQ
jgi:hypothetical protein